MRLTTGRAIGRIQADAICIMGRPIDRGITAHWFVRCGNLHPPAAGVCSMPFATKRLGELPDATAPDGSEVRVLCSTSRGSLAHFTLPPHAVSKAMAHRTVEEVWYFVSGRGQMWRRSHDHEEIVDVEPGVAITIPAGPTSSFAPSRRSLLRLWGQPCHRGRARARRLPSMGSGIQLFNRLRRTSG